MSTENTETVISINHVSKVYKLFEKPMDRLKESLSLTHKNYHTDHFALEDISLEVHKGECVGIIGTNGSGKSTLIQHFNGLLKPDRGTIVVDGCDITAKNTVLRDVRRKVGLVFQYPEYQLFEDTVSGGGRRKNDRIRQRLRRCFKAIPHKACAEDALFLFLQVGKTVIFA